jgi:hypothetical protein
MPESARISACRTARARKQSRREKSTVSMVWEGYRSRLCKCNNFNRNGLFGRDTPDASHIQLDYQVFITFGFCDLSQNKRR